jgi:hypothetical protein
MPGPPTCERHIFYDGANTWIIVDRVSAPEPHDILVNYQFATQAVRRLSPTTILAGDTGQPQILLLHEDRDVLTAAIEPATLSRVYGQKEPAARLCLRQRADRTRIVTAIHGFRAEDPPPASFQVAGDDLLRIRLQLGHRTSPLAIDLRRDNRWWGSSLRAPTDTRVND